MPNKTTMLHVRLTEEEAEAFKRLAGSVGENRARLLRKMIRESVNGIPDLLHDEQSLLMVAIRQLVGIAHNLNQITAAMHSGKTHRSVDEGYLTEIKKYVSSTTSSLEDCVKKTRSRWVKRS